MFYLASNIWKRHHLLEETIGYLAVEKTSYENITTLFYISVFLVPILTILELTFYLLYQCKVSNSIYNIKQDGPSLESSSYLNVSLRYLGPWDPWTLGLLDLFPPPTHPDISPYILLPPPILSSYSPSLVWFGYVYILFL